MYVLVTFKFEEDPIKMSCPQHFPQGRQILKSIVRSLVRNFTFDEDPIKLSSIISMWENVSAFKAE